MKTALVSIVFTYLAVFAAFYAAPKDRSYKLGPIAAYWLIATALIFLAPYKLPVLIFLGLVLAMVGNGSPEGRVFIYVAAFCAVPFSYAEKVPFPGLNYLIDLDHAKIAAIFLLGPSFVRLVLEKPGKRLRIVDAMLLAYILLTGLMSIRDLPFTSMLRMTLDQFLLIYLPYIVVSRSLKTQEDMENVLKALYLLGAILAGIGLISMAQRWNYYLQLDPNAGYKGYIEVRNGLLRIYATLTTTVLSLVMGAAMICAFALRAAKTIPGFLSLVAIALFGVIAFATGSRGGFMAVILTAGSYLLFLHFNAGIRKLFITTLVSGVIVLIVLVMQDNTAFDDGYGTYNYRADLLRTSIPQIASRPIFGSSDFMQKPEFQALRQGEGIIDLVNTYLQVALFYGFSGLFLFLGVNIIAIKSGLRALSELPPLKEASEAQVRARRTICVFLASLLGYLGLIATTSAVSYTWHFGYLFLSLLVAQVRVLDTTQTAPAASHTNGADPSLEEKPVRVPYGARFVRRS